MRLYISSLLLFLVFQLNGQYRIIGFAYDQYEDPYIGTEVRLLGDDTKAVTQTTVEGRFEFHDIERGEYTVLVITEYGLIKKEINLRTSLELHLQRSRTIKADEVVVSAVRSDDEPSLVKYEMDREEIETRNLGQDVPFILKWTPSAITTSDAGTGIGYTGIRIRGSDPTRINVTINGVPLNDAESQGVFWVDLPDIMGSTQSVQIQRGVGESTYGTGAFGATINLNTIETNIKPYGEISGSIGSFDTYRGSVRFGTGLLGKHFTIDGRLSTIQSDGFIDRASADLRSFYGSAAYIGAKTSVRFTAFGGKETTYQSWFGVPAQYIDDPDLRTFNAAGTEKPGEPYDNEVDDYTQTHYQLHLNQNIFTQLQGYLTLHYTKGKGYFEQYKGVDFFSDSFASFLAQYDLEGDDAIRRRWLDNDFYGFIAGLHYQDPVDRFTFRLSGGFNRYEGDHFGEIIESLSGADVSDLPYYYFNDAVKTSGNIFAKLNLNLAENLTGMIDLQYRGVDYTFEGRDNDGSPLDQTVEYNFFNPKAGLTYTFTDDLTLSYFFGIANREPNRDDFTESSAASRPDSERLYDNELTLRFTKPKFDVEATGYYMIYDDQLALTGRINDVGELTRVNVDDSYRLGLELNATYRPLERLTLGASATLSQNRIREYTEFIDDWDTGEQFTVMHEDVDLAFSPSTLVMGNVGYQFLQLDRHAATVGFQTKFVGEQYVDNTGREGSILDAYTFTDVQLQYAFKYKAEKTLSLNFLLRNVFDAEYSTNAWNYRFRTESDPTGFDPYSEAEGNDIYHQRGFFPQAGINFLLGLTLSI